MRNIGVRVAYRELQESRNTAAKAFTSEMMAQHFFRPKQNQKGINRLKVEGVTCLIWLFTFVEILGLCEEHEGMTKWTGSARSK